MIGIDANRRLAELLGWTDIVDVGGAWLGMPPGGSQHSRDQARVPDWVGDWNACGPLMVQFIRRMRLWPHRAVVGTTTVGADLARDTAASESEDARTRRLIVDAVIAELEVTR